MVEKHRSQEVKSTSKQSVTCHNLRLLSGHSVTFFNNFGGVAAASDATERSWAEQSQNRAKPSDAMTSVQYITRVAQKR